MSEHHTMRLDVGRNIAEKLEVLLAREFAIAVAGGLPPREVAVLAMEVAASVSSALILLAVQLRNADITAEAMFDDTLVMLTKLVANRRDRSLAELEKRRAAKFAVRLQ